MRKSVKTTRSAPAPVQGRWLSPDPMGLGAVDPMNPQSWNRYAYVLNNPLAMIDPMGDAGYDGCSNWVQFDLCGEADGGGGFFLDSSNFGFGSEFASDGNPVVPGETITVTDIPVYANPVVDSGLLMEVAEFTSETSSGGGGGGGSSQGAANNCAPGEEGCFNLARAPAKDCVGVGRGLEGNAAFAGHQGGIPGVTVQLNTAAVTPTQWGVPNGAALAPFASQIFGQIGNAYFTGITDVNGGKSPIPGVNVRAALQQLFPGRLILEIPGARDQGANAPVLMQVPGALNCPTGTNQILADDALLGVG